MSPAHGQGPGSRSRYFTGADGGLGLGSGRPGWVVRACTRPCLPEREAIGGSSLEPGEGSRCQTRFDGDRSSQTPSWQGTHGDVTFPEKY